MVQARRLQQSLQHMMDEPPWESVLRRQPRYTLNSPPAQPKSPVDAIRLLMEQMPWGSLAGGLASAPPTTDQHRMASQQQGADAAPLEATAAAATSSGSSAAAQPASNAPNSSHNAPNLSPAAAREASAGACTNTEDVLQLLRHSYDAVKCADLRHMQDVVRDVLQASVSPVPPGMLDQLVHLVETYAGALLANMLINNNIHAPACFCNFCPPFATRAKVSGVPA